MANMNWRRLWRDTAAQQSQALNVRRFRFMVTNRNPVFVHPLSTRCPLGVRPMSSRCLEAVDILLVQLLCEFYGHLSFLIVHSWPFQVTRPLSLFLHLPPLSSSVVPFPSSSRYDRSLARPSCHWYTLQTHNYYIYANTWAVCTHASTSA